MYISDCWFFFLAEIRILAILALEQGSDGLLYNLSNETSTVLDSCSQIEMLRESNGKNNL